jgi:hypothetical protein
MGDASQASPIGWCFPLAGAMPCVQGDTMTFLFLFPLIAHADANFFTAEDALAQFKTFAAAECDVWSDNASCRGSSFGSSCITEGYVTGACVPYGAKNIHGNYKCLCH